MTDPAVTRIAEIAHQAHRDGTRRLVLLSGVPGSGKTLVGLRAVHAPYLDDLAEPRNGVVPSAPSLFLSGNGPLVTVLQHVLRGGGGGGRTFVRHIKDYLDAYVPRPEKSPPQHVLVFDEAQRAFAADMVRQKHRTWPETTCRSEPELFIGLCDRIPRWAMLVGLIGTGQEIGLGEEKGIRQWREAIECSRSPQEWVVHAPADLEPAFVGSGLRTVWEPALNLNTSLRFHLAQDLHAFVGALLDVGEVASVAALVADRLWKPTGRRMDGIRLWATRDLGAAKAYLRERYCEEPQARFGLLASARDRLAERHGVDNSWNATKRVRLGPWYADGEESASSCRRLREVVTEFGAQGLELDMALLSWGSDLRRVGGRWCDDLGRKYRAGSVELRNPLQLRLNAYRVLLTRGRDGTVLFVPPDPVLDETWSHLLGSGFRPLE